MRTIWIILFLFCFFRIAHAQVPSSCIVNPILINAYDRDIKQLATNRIFQLQSPDTALVTIPHAYIDTISEGLSAIFNASSIKERDSVFNLYCVHNNNGWPYDYAGFLLKVDTNFAWTQAWMNLNTITGNAHMDTIVTRYNLKVTRFYTWAIGNYAELAPVSTADSSWNILALLDSMKMVAGVLDAEPNSYVGNAGKIEYYTVGNTRYYDFYFEFQDCFDGCDSYRMWKFKVNPDCSVEYLGFVDWSFWWPVFVLDPPLNCNITASIPEGGFKTDEFLVYPIPAHGKLSIENTTSDASNKTRVELYTIEGEIIGKSSFAGFRTELDLTNLASGIYFLRINTENTTILKKIVLY